MAKTEPMTRVEAKELLQREFCRPLRGVAFDKGDDDLVPVKRDEQGQALYGGACAQCVACSAALGEERKQGSTMYCFRVACFNEKLKLTAEALKKEAVKRGAEVLSREIVVKIFDRHSGELLHNCGYVDVQDKADPQLDGHCNEAIMPTWATLLMAKEKGGERVQRYFAINPIKGHACELVKYEEAFAKVKGLKLGTVPEAPQGSEEPDRLPPQTVYKADDDDDGPTWDADAAAQQEAENRERQKREEARLMTQIHTVLGNGCDVVVLMQTFARKVLTDDARALVAQVLDADDLTQHLQTTIPQLYPHTMRALLLCSVARGLDDETWAALRVVGAKVEEDVEVEGEALMQAKDDIEEKRQALLYEKSNLKKPCRAAPDEEKKAWDAARKRIDRALAKLANGEEVAA
ncbi:MAG: hypothetical protein ACOYMN_19275 [Roseimicrobium sp.]